MRDFGRLFQTHGRYAGNACDMVSETHSPEPILRELAGPEEGLGIRMKIHIDIFPTNPLKGI